jgi:hypothetical protein
VREEAPKRLPVLQRRFQPNVFQFPQGDVRELRHVLIDLAQLQFGVVLERVEATMFCNVGVP